MIKILLADDHALLREGLRKSFEAAGDNVVGEASTGEEAVALAKALQPDVVLMDLKMPEMDGLEASRRLNAQYGAKRPRIVAMTANAMQGDREMCLAAGMDDYIAKPIRVERLVEALKQVPAWERD